jgi:hypothetical protein
MGKPKIAIIGIGGATSVGYTLSEFIARDPAVMDSIDELILNKGDDSPAEIKEAEKEKKTPPKRDFVNSHIREILFPAVYGINREDYMNKIRYKTQDEIAKESALTFFFYEKKYSQRKGGPLFWEPNNRKKFFKYNHPATVEIARKFKGALGQCVVVTNPTLDIARTFYKESGLEEGQVLAFNPDHFRMILKLKSLENRVPKIREYYDKIFLVGDHGGTSEIVTADDSFFSLKDTDGVKIHEIVEKVMSTGQYVSYMHSGVAGNVVPHMLGFARSTILSRERNKKKQYVWGIPYRGIFCSIPVVNEFRGEKEGIPIYRARVLDEFK